MYGIRLFFVLLLITLILPFVSTASEENPEIILDYPWDHSPITVYIDNKNVPEHYSPTYYAQIEKALEYWEEGGNGKLEYTPVFELVDSEEADIRIRWTENLENVEGAPSGVAGYARPREVGGRFLKVDIVLEVGNYKGKPGASMGIQQCLQLQNMSLDTPLDWGTAATEETSCILNTK